jgi:amylosucrase/maltose alpha-D-glucosyltransferase/alpha-amylase
MPVSDRHCQVTLERLKSLLHRHFPDGVNSPDWGAFELRLDEHFPDLFRPLLELYGHHFDFFYHLQNLLESMAETWLDRSPELKSIDVMRQADPEWFQSGRLIGAMAYIDLFSGTIEGLRKRIPYLQELGITYLHLMPPYRTPDGDDDGGYAVSSYRELDPGLGTIEELEELAAELRRHGISLVLDFVFNHTSDDHEWARRALDGDETCQDYYLMFSSREVPDDYERHLRSIFPDEHQGSFTYLNRLKKWVWTTFHTYQWDLNYRNPEVFNAMAAEMLFLANRGVEILRLDAVPFIWKQQGTNCENLPEAHRLIEAFNAVARIVAPAMAFKSEAIVAPDEIASYISRDQCPISYNPLLMALLWESLATRDARLLQHSMRKRFAIDPRCAWVNYTRSHDDIGWGFDDNDAWEMGIDPRGHRSFLNEFFHGRHHMSFSEGELFQLDPATGDARICGSAASLCGLGRAIDRDDERLIELAIRRILLIQGVVFTIGGIPLIYLGDEIGTLNDPSYREDPEKALDSRWLHRPFFDWDKAERRHDPGSIEGRIYQGMLALTRIRLNNAAVAGGDTEIVDPGNPHVFGYFRITPEQSTLCLANFSEHPQTISAPRLGQLGLRKGMVDVISGTNILASAHVDLEPLQFMVLLPQGG